jgi:D-sedoheptulose 7-phosphate isomerase
MAVAHFNIVSAALDQLDRKALDRLYGLVKHIRDGQGVVWICGNGGSFLTAQHWSLDLTKFAHAHAVALGSNAGLMTAVANDESYDTIFSLELQQWAKPGDLLICLSCSGISANIRTVVSAAHELGIASILLTGTINDDVARADHVIRVWSQDYAVIEDCHSAIGHWLAKALK